jgi:hypothetical protein
MTSNNVNIGSNHIETPQDHNEETSCINVIKSFFSGACRKICIGENIQNFCVYNLIGVIGGGIGIFVGNNTRDSSSDETSYITMKKSDYIHKLSDSSVVPALVGGAVAATIIFFSMGRKSNQADTNRPTDRQDV